MTNRWMEQHREPEDRPGVYKNLIYDRTSTADPQGKDRLFDIWSESIGHPYRNQCKTSPTHTLQKINANGTKHSNENYKIFKLSEEYLRVCLYDIEIVKDILRCKSIDYKWKD